jgi:hypothetical protein
MVISHFALSCTRPRMVLSSSRRGSCRR